MISAATLFDDLRAARSMDLTIADLEQALADCLGALDQLWSACGESDDWSEPRHVALAVVDLLGMPHNIRTNARDNARGARQSARHTPAGDPARAAKSSYFLPTPAAPAKNPAFSR